MMIRELECCKLSSNFTISNSDVGCNNMFAVIVRAGVHIMTVNLCWNSTVNSIYLERYLLKPPDEFPLADFDINVNQLNREEYFSLLLNSKYTPKIEKCLTPAIYIKQVDFADMQFSYIIHPVIGVLTNHGCLHLFVKYPFTWKKVIDISLLWKKHCLINFCKHFSQDFESLKKRYSLLNIVSFAWCSGFQSQDNSSVLACITEDGKLSMWNICHHNYELSSLLCVLELELCVNFLCWHLISPEEGWITFKASDGMIKIYSCDKKNSGIHVEFLFDLWNQQDYIYDAKIKILKRVSDTLIVITKDTYIFFYIIKDNKILFENFFVYHKKIVGVEILNAETVFVMLINQEMFTLRLKIENNIFYENVPVVFNLKSHLKHYNCFGITFSKNKLFCTIYLSFAQNFDHLSLKEPRSVLYCSSEDFCDVSFSLLQNKLKEYNLSDIYEYIEYFRINSIQRDSPLDKNAITNCYKYLNEDLVICRKIFQMLRVLAIYNLNKNDINEDVVENINAVLAVCNFFYYKEKFDVRKQTLFFKWLSCNILKLPDNGALYKIMKDIFDLSNEFTNVHNVELCEICKADITDHKNLKFLVCEKGHKIIRCSLTFLPIGIQPYYECSLCYAVILQSEGIYKCVICDNGICTM